MKYSRSFFFPLLLIFLAAGISAQQPSESSELGQQIRKDSDAGHYAGAIASLKELQTGDDKIFRLNNYDYLLARLLEKTGDLAGAMTNYQAVIKRNSVLSDYALWHMAALMRASGNLPLERIYLHRFLSTGADSLINEAAQMRLAQSYFESKEFAAAVKTLQRSKFSVSAAPLASLTNTSDPTFGNLSGNDPRTREALVLLGRSYEQNGWRRQAHDVFDRLYSSLPDTAMPDDFALAAVRQLDILDGSSEAPDSAPEIAESEHLKRAAIYQFNRDFLAAELHYKALIDHFPQSGNVPDAMYQIGRGLVQQQLYEEAITWFERVQTEYPSAPASMDSLNQAASAYARLKKAKEATSRYQKYIALNPDSDTAERAFLNIIDIWRDEDEFTKALEWTEKTEERFSGKTTAAVAIFDRAKIQMSQNNWEGALKSLEYLQKQNDLGGVRVPGGTSKSEAAFLHAFVLEQLRNYSEAADEYLAIPDGRNEYYGWRATERLKTMGKDPVSSSLISTKLSAFRISAGQILNQKDYDVARKAAQNALRLTDDPADRSRLLDLVRQTYSSLPAYNNIPSGKLQNVGRQELLKTKTRKDGETDIHQILADELLFLGLYDEGAPELEVALRQKGLSANKFQPANSPAVNPLADLSADMAYTLAALYKRAGMPHRAAAYAEPLWKKMPEDYLIEIAPRDTIEMLYPAPFAGILLAETSPRRIDPRFVLSIMRQESRFRPDVKSAAAARGLMQFISSTADTLAEKLGKKNFEQNELYRPAEAIRFGSQYLKDLFDIFPDEPQAVAASYNGGEHNMGRWLKRAHSSEPDLYVPEIAFSQSKDYVYKVMANYRIYRQLYDEELNPIKAQ
jgi:soluble lytic murein transglycosylase